MRVRFPREFSPDRLRQDSIAPDRFSGLEWRVVLDQGRTVRLVAFIIPPDPATLRMPRWASNEAAVAAGRSQVRLCDPGSVTLRCGRPASALVRLVDDRLELLIGEPAWVLAVTGLDAPVVHLAVRQGGEELWTTTAPVAAEPP